MLGLYDPDRSQTLTNLGEIRPWSAFLGAIRAALDGAAAARRRRPPHPDRVGQLADARRADPRPADALPVARSGISGIRPAARTRAAGAKLAFGEYVDAQYRFDRADVIVSLDADFLGMRARRPALRARLRRAAAARSTPTA